MSNLKIHILLFIMSIANIALGQLNKEKANKLEDDYISCTPCTEQQLDSIYQANKIHLNESDFIVLSYIYKGQALKRNGLYKASMSLFKNIPQLVGEDILFRSDYYFDYRINLGITYRVNHLLDSSILIHKQTLNLLSRVENQEYIYPYYEKVHTNISTNYKDQNNYLEAINHLLLAMDDGKNTTYYTLQNLAQIYSHLNMIDEATSYYLKSRNLADLNTDKLASSYLNIGSMYDEKENYDTALIYLDSCINIVKSKKTKSYCLYNLASLHNDINQPKKARIYLKKLEEVNSSLNSNSTQLLITSCYAQTNLLEGNHQKVIDLLENINISSIPWGELQLECFEYLSASYEVLGNDKQALLNWKNYIELDKSISNDHNQKQYVSLLNKYYLLQKQNKIDILALENENLSQETLLNTQENAMLNNQIDIKQKQLIYFVVFIAILLLLVGLLVRFIFQRNTLKNTLIKEKADSLNKKLEMELILSESKGEEKERTRLAGELHDGIGSALSGLRLKYHNETYEKSQLTTELNSIYNEVRLIAHRLSPPVYNDVKRLIKNLCERFFDYTPIQCEIIWFPEENNYELPSEIKLHFYRIVQEIFNNIIKHSSCQKVEITVNQDSNSINIIIEDDGVGFDMDSKNDTFGINSLKRRSQLINLELIIDAKINRGTSFSLTL